jgi:EAL domain-containing protein (putative c-di-GMP-specific phosphodiesterase class I)
MLRREGRDFGSYKRGWTVSAEILPDQAGGEQGSSGAPAATPISGGPPVGCVQPMDRCPRPGASSRHAQMAVIAAAVRSALRENRLLFAFQPVVCAASGRVDYFECLLRMRAENGALVACGAFIAAVEEAGLIGLIDRHVLERAFAELAASPQVRLGFNVSGLTAGDRPWLRSLIARLRRQPELASRVVVEITETAALVDLDESARFAETLRHAGCRVALDDFGAGHTSLRHLQVLAVDTIKIDGAFVRSLAAARENRVILRHLLGLARGFGLNTVAECVETAGQAALLRDEGIGYLQGYHIGRPTIERPWQAGLGPASEPIACE